MTIGLDDFAPGVFLDFPAASTGERDLCLRLEVLLIKMQDRQPSNPVIPVLVRGLNRIGHRLLAREVPGLDHFFEGTLGEGRVLEIRGVDEWFSVRVRSAGREDFRLAL